MPYRLAKRIYDQLKWSPTGPEQAAPIEAQDRFCCMVGGERSGKSEVAEKILLPHVLSLPFARPERFFDANGKLIFHPKAKRPQNPDFVIFGPTYRPPKIEFERLENDLRRLGKLSEPHLSKPADGPQNLVTTDGVVVQTWSCEVPDNIRSIDLEGALVVEAGGVMYAAIERIRGRVAAKRGFITYNGTIENSQRWWTDWLVEGKRPNEKGIVSYSIPSWANKHEFPGGESDPEITAWRKFLGEDLFMERCAAIARPPRFRVLKGIEERHIRYMDIPDDATHEIWIDPGFASAYAILFVAIWKDLDGKKFFYVYDELYEQSKTTRDMIELCRKNRYWADIRTGVIDIASKGHRDATDSSLEIWEQLTNIRFAKKYWLEDRLIERIVTCANIDQFAVHPRCEGLIAEAGLGAPVFPEMHPWRFPTDRDNRIVSDKPEDKWNHCHDDKTEILTERGWVPFPELLDDDRVATWGEAMKFEKPLSVTRAAYSGDLFVREGHQVNFAVTPNHRMWVANQYSVKRKREPQYGFIEVRDLPARSWVRRTAPGWTGENPALTFPQRTKTGYHSVTPDPIALARFVGLWLAEGCLGRGGGKKYVIVDQKKHVEVVREIVRAVGLNWCETISKQGMVRFSIQSKEFYSYFAPDGNHCTSATKRVPREWINATPEAINALLDGYRVGDGSYWGREGWWYGSSCSTGLLGDLQEMAFRVGLIANVYKATEAEPELNRLEGWRIGVRPSDGTESGLGLVTLDASQIERRAYDGMVYCVTTESGIIATRRGGRVMWGGNSAKALGYGLLSHLGQVETSRKGTSFNRLRRESKGSW